MSRKNVKPGNRWMGGRGRQGAWKLEPPRIVSQGRSSETIGTRRRKSKKQSCLLLTQQGEREIITRGRNEHHIGTGDFKRVRRIRLRQVPPTIRTSWIFPPPTESESIRERRGPKTQMPSTIFRQMSGSSGAPNFLNRRQGDKFVDWRAESRKR